MVNRLKASANRLQENAAVSFVTQVVGIVNGKNLPGFAQMMAYSLLFATVPFLMVLVAGAGLITRIVNADMENPALPVLDWLQQYIPKDAIAFLEDPIQNALNQPQGWALAVGALLALWGVRGAIGAIILGLNVSYGVEKDPRSFLVSNGIALFLAAMVVLLISVVSILFTLGTGIGKEIAGSIGLQGAFVTLSGYTRWPIIAAVCVFAVMVLHWMGPADSPPFLWCLPGAAFTVVGMVVATYALGFWFSMAGGFDKTYGVFGSVMAFITWLWVMGLIVLIGGAINAVAHPTAGRQYRPESV